MIKFELDEQLENIPPGAYYILPSDVEVEDYEDETIVKIHLKGPRFNKLEAAKVTSKYVAKQKFIWLGIPDSSHKLSFYIFLIKQIRNDFDYGLKEAKELVDVRFPSIRKDATDG